MELYIVRHGQTVWNLLGKMQGRADIELNENGRMAATNLGSELENVNFDAIYSSPLVRAYETACLIRGDRNIPIIKDDRLMEIDFGEAEGTDYHEWLENGSRYQAFFNSPADYIPPANGERLEDVCARTKDFVREVIEPGKYDRVMIVGHGALNKGLMCYLENNDISNYWGDGLQKNCQATIFSYDGKIWRKMI